MSPDWIASKKAIINPKNEKDNKLFQWAIISGLNYNKINEKHLKKILKFKRVDTDFSSHQRDWEEFEQNNTSIVLNILFVPHNSEEIKLVYKSNYNKRKNQVILLMINDEYNKCYYFAVKSLSELNSSGWLRGKKEAIIKSDTGFEDALDDALNYQTIKTNPERRSKLKPYINKYNWEGIDFPAGPKERQKCEQNNKTIALNILFIPHNTKTISVAYRSEYNNKSKKQVILLMITDGKKWHYLAVTNLSALLQRMSSNHDGDFYCLNYFTSYTTKNKLEEHEEICNNHDSYHIEMPKQAEKILKYIHGEKSLKCPFVIYLDLECLLKKEQSCQSNPENLTQKKKLYMSLLVGQCLQVVHLMKKKINLVITEEKIVLENYVKS